MHWARLEMDTLHLRTEEENSMSHSVCTISLRGAVEFPQGTGTERRSCIDKEAPRSYLVLHMPLQEAGHTPQLHRLEHVHPSLYSCSFVLPGLRAETLHHT